MIVMECSQQKHHIDFIQECDSRDLNLSESISKSFLPILHSRTHVSIDTLINLPVVVSSPKCC